MGDIKFISKYGQKFVLIFGILFILSLIFGFLKILFGILFLIVLFIYRNPERMESIDDKKALYSPIDGKILNIEVFDDCQKISIYNGIFSVGIIRIPLDSRLISLDHKNGLYLCNFLKSSNLLNEKVVYNLKNEFIDFKLEMISGVLSKKIYFEKFEFLKATKRLGFMSNGVINLYLPKNIRLLVSKNDRIRACEALGFIE